MVFLNAFRGGSQSTTFMKRPMAELDILHGFLQVQLVYLLLFLFSTEMAWLHNWNSWLKYGNDNGIWLPMGVFLCVCTVLVLCLYYKTQNFIILVASYSKTLSALTINIMTSLDLMRVMLFFPFITHLTTKHIVGYVVQHDSNRTVRKLYRKG